jgi:hypothetical protein
MVVDSERPGGATGGSLYRVKIGVPGKPLP